jgi:methyl-accepting chemotaxis protein
MKIKTKIITMGIGVTVIPVVVMLLLIGIQKQRLTKKLGVDLDSQMNNELSTIAKDVYALCRTQNDSVTQTLLSNLNVARDSLRKKGIVSLSEETVSWKVKNQLSGATATVSLPKFIVGDQWLGQNAYTSQYTPLVDDVVKLVGATCTIFQRMNDQGDMLRVATTVVSKDGSRAIGTYIPAVNPDGKPNPVVSTVSNGRTYQGKAFVVDSWYIAAYEPIKDANGKIIGMLYVGVKQENVLSFRQAILSITIGKTGYVWVLAGSGDSKGVYLISKDGKRDGENIWDSQDANGNFFIRDIITQAVKLRGGEVIFYKYPWKNPEDPKAKDKIAAVTYFEPWDWVIGAGAYKEDISTASEETNNSLNNLLWSSIATGLIVVVLAIIMSFAIGVSIAKPITKICIVANKIAAGDIDQDIDYSSKDEFGELAHTFSNMTASLKEMVKQLRKTADKVAGSAEMMSSTTSEMNASTQEVSSAIQQVSKGASTQAVRVRETFDIMEKSVVSLKQVVTNAEATSEAVKETSSKAEIGRNAAQDAMQKIERLTDSVMETTQVIQGLGQMSQQIGEITETITSIADQTNLLALNAAIEAARAGEAGRGFAVVAEEVRKLAEGSAEAVRKIGGLIKSIQSETNRAVSSIEESSKEVKEGKDQVAEITQALTQINTTVKSANALANQIATAGQDRVKEIERVVKAVNEISNIAKNSADTAQQLTATTQEQTASMEEMSASSQELARLASDLKSLIAKFKLKEDKA